MEDGRRRYRFRYYGSGLARYVGDGTGKYLDEVIAPQFIVSWYAAYDAALAMQVPLRFVSQFRALDLEYMNAESLVAPVEGADGSPAWLLTSVVYTPRI